ncbi:DUF2165 family protein [Variovorax sp. H27-G14]|uniref:DUF2165 family protein n=1 Tax=Variovorax sp. H27-G14 TaxID=3111914 RepID=UPI0038FC9BC3
MNLSTSLWLFQAVHAIGFAVWLSIAAINNCRCFAASAAAVGGTMSMALLRTAPAVETPLLARAIASTAVHRAALLMVLALQIAAALACWVGSFELFFGAGLAGARPWLNMALSAFAAFLFAMHVGGIWFAYWIRQETLQLTHLSLLMWVMAAFFLFNLRWQ